MLERHLATLLCTIISLICSYGGRATTEQCSVAIIVMSIQSIVGVIIQVH